MTHNLKKARELLQNNSFTCIVCNDDRTYTSTLRGIKPLVAWYQGHMNFNGYSAADKVIGKGAAFLYVLLGVKQIYAGVISQSALELLRLKGISVEYSLLVKNIINRNGDGICPFEETVLNIDDEVNAYVAICKKMNELNIKMED